jgi:hypothetical protein
MRPMTAAHLLACSQEQCCLAVGGAHTHSADCRLHIAHGVINGKRLRLIPQLVPAFLHGQQQRNVLMQGLLAPSHNTAAGLQLGENTA